MILVLGSINADLFFSVDRLPARGETVLTPSAVVRPGGKGANQAAAAARTGAETAFFGCVGNDGFADIVLASLAWTGCDVSGVRRLSGATGTAMVVVDANGENLIVVASGANGAVGAEMLPPDRLGPGTTLVCQMEIDPAETARALGAAKAAGARTILNLAPARSVAPAVLADVDVLVVNKIEVAAVAAGLDTGTAPPRDLARMLAVGHGLICVVTLGGEGAVAVAPDGGAWSIGVLPVDRVVDTVGAGDAFVGVLAAALDGGADLPAGLRRASVAAGLACTVEGAMQSLPDAAAIAERLDALAPARRLD